MLEQQNQRILFVSGLRSARFRRFSRFWFCFLFLAVIFPAGLKAQTETLGGREVTATSPGIKAFSLGVAPVFQLGSKVNGGGSLSINHLYASGGFVYQLTEKFGTGAGLFYNLSDFRFAGVNAIPLADPWDTIVNYGVGIPFIFSATEHWQFIVTPVGQFSGETGANWGSSLVYGGLASVTYNWGKGSFIGIGVAGFQYLAQSEIFPYVFMNWHITDRWRLSTPLQASPSGPGGLKLSYDITPHLEIGISAAYRFNRFRLDKNGPIPNGIGQYSQLPVVANLSYTFPFVNVYVYGGVAFNNSIWMENSNGDGIYRADQKPAPLVGFNITFGVEPTQFRAEPWQIRMFRNFL